MRSVLGLLLCLSFYFPVQAQDDGLVQAGEPIVESPEASSSFSLLDSPTEIENFVVRGRVVAVHDFSSYEYTEGQEFVSATLEVQVESDRLDTDSLMVDYNRSLAGGEKVVEVGDLIMVNVSSDGTGQKISYFVDYVREASLVGLLIIFCLLVLAVGGWKGVSSIVGLVTSFGIIFGVVLPGIQQGINPVLVALGGASLIIGVTFYVSHGLNEKTHLAIAGTLVSLLLTGVLAMIFIEWSHLSGFGAEEAAFLQVVKDGGLNVKGLLLAGIIIGTLGVLDDITISQASIVKELVSANSKLRGKKLFVKAMNVGKDHIASLVNTLILVYAGSSLPLLLLFTLDESRAVSDVVNYEIVAEEVVRTLVGSIGLVAAVPVTTLLAVYWFGRKNNDTRTDR